MKNRQFHLQITQTPTTTCTGLPPAAAACQINMLYTDWWPLHSQSRPTISEAHSLRNKFLTKKHNSATMAEGAPLVTAEWEEARSERGQSMEQWKKEGEAQNRERGGVKKEELVERVRRRPLKTERSEEWAHVRADGAGTREKNHQDPTGRVNNNSAAFLSAHSLSHSDVWQWKEFSDLFRGLSIWFDLLQLC